VIRFQPIGRYQDPGYQLVVEEEAQGKDQLDHPAREAQTKGDPIGIPTVDQGTNREVEGI